MGPAKDLLAGDDLLRTMFESASIGIALVGTDGHLRRPDLRKVRHKPLIAFAHDSRSFSS